ncbi:FHIPEP family type III secretion protein [Pseudomonas aeruginosa]
MGDGEYLVQLQEVPVARGCLRPGWLLVRERAAQLELLAVPTSRRSCRCRERKRRWVEQASGSPGAFGCACCLGLEQVLTWHLSHVLREYAEDFIGIQETRYLLEPDGAGLRRAGEGSWRIVPLQRMTEILQRLVGGDISIRNMRAILEAMVEWGEKEKDVVQLTGGTSAAASKRYICYKYSSGSSFPLPAGPRAVEGRSAVASAKPAPAATWPRPGDSSRPSSKARAADRRRSRADAEPAGADRFHGYPAATCASWWKRLLRRCRCSYQELTQQVNISRLAGSLL